MGDQLLALRQAQSQLYSRPKDQKGSSHLPKFSRMSFAKCTNFKLRHRTGRESHHGIVVDLAQGELADAPVQREAIELRLARIR